jgi:hypothetical protein
MRLSVLLYSIPLCFLLISCHWDVKTVDPSKPKFRTNDSSVLFFKNLRQVQYYKEVLSEAKIDVYRHKKVSDLKSTSTFQLAIVHNWMIDEVVIFIEPTGAYLTDTLPIVIGSQPPMLFQKGNKYEQYEWVANIYNAIILEKEISVLDPIDGEKPLFPSGIEKEAFRVSSKDFFKLVQVFR